MKKLVVDDALKAGTEIGPVVDDRQLRKNMEYVEIGQKEGARLAYGGERLSRETDGYYIARREPLPFQAVASTGGIHLGGSVLVGFGIGLVSASTAAALLRASRATAVGVAVGLVLLLAAGLSAIAHATSLERSARPPFIMFGLPAVAIALAVAVPAFVALTLPHGTTTRLD